MAGGGRAPRPTSARRSCTEDFRFNRAYLQGAKEIEPRWKRCVQATDRALGDALGQLYVEKTFGADGKARMKAMIEAITAALREDIETLAWMTPETRKKALAKLAAFSTRKVGYPDEWKDYSSVEVKRDDYFGNSRRARVFEIKRDQARIGKPTDRTLWGMTPPTVNAYYNAANNEIVFPAGILQPPFFDRAIDDPVNFGGIGVVIGHEYTHGFDDQGSKFDAVGNLANWWTADDRKAFEERTDCIAKEYDGFVTVKDPANGDVHLNGRLTLGENTADNGGLRRLLRGAPEDARGQAADEGRRLHARAAVLPGLRERLVPERHRGGGPPARADRPALVRRVPGHRQRQQHARSSPRRSAARPASRWCGRTRAARGESSAGAIFPLAQTGTAA